MCKTPAWPSSRNYSGGRGVSSFQPTDERDCTDHLLAMEACKISDGGQLNSGTVEASLDYEAITHAFGVSLSGVREILKSRRPRAPEMQSNLLVAIKKFLNRRLLI
jgi:hypothetical protein